MVKNRTVERRSVSNLSHTYRNHAKLGGIILHDAADVVTRCAEVCFGCG